MVEVDKEVWTLEDIVLGHRYLYHVLNTPVISDQEYDKLDKQAKLSYPVASPIYDMGSDLKESYTPRQIACACLLKAKVIWT